MSRLGLARWQEVLGVRGHRCRLLRRVGVWLVTEHEMIYRAGSFGFASIGVPDREPHWRCSCGPGWKFPARSMPSRKTGNNEIEAKRSHEMHRKAIR